MFVILFILISSLSTVVNQYVFVILFILIGSLSTVVNQYELTAPPSLVLCQDYETSSCRDSLTKDPTFCDDPANKRLFCPRTCNTCSTCKSIIWWTVSSLFVKNDLEWISVKFIFNVLFLSASFINTVLNLKIWFHMNLNWKAKLNHLKWINK